MCNKSENFSAKTVLNGSEAYKAHETTCPNRMLLHSSVHMYAFHWVLESKQETVLTYIT